MFPKTAFVLAVLCSNAAIAEMAAPSTAATTLPADQAASRAQPYAISGPVHVRIREPRDVTTALASADPTAQREMAYHHRDKRQDD